MSPRTERADVRWVVRDAPCHGLRHPGELGEEAMIAWLTYLAAERQLARPSQMQALSAFNVLDRVVLGRTVRDLGGVLRATTPTRLPVVSSREEVPTSWGAAPSRRENAASADSHGLREVKEVRGWRPSSAERSSGAK